jgi:hypothetical protein
MKLKIKKKNSLKKNYAFSIDCHSRFYPECNTERGFIDTLSIALGCHHIVAIGSKDFINVFR